jgi:nitroimidazol reductase NimA-like FMN-containing flavoprotein (pyridoxamine 5'-phosphate oxidase superfamily)
MPPPDGTRPSPRTRHAAAGRDAAVPAARPARLSRHRHASAARPSRFAYAVGMTDRTAVVPPSDRVRVRRKPDRGRYDRETIDAIIDAAIVGHVGYVIDGQPYVTPTAVWRQGDRIYWHGSTASRMIRAAADGIPVCVTVSHVDSLVLARSGFHHAVDYRSVMVLGTARAVEDPDELLEALEAFTDHLYPGRWAQLRPATRSELKATAVLSLDLSEASAKVRDSGAGDDEADLDWPAWGGVIPVRLVTGEPQPDGSVRDGIPVPTLSAVVFPTD